MATELAKAYVQIVPTAKGIKAALENELGGAAGGAGEKAGGIFAGGFGKALGKAGKLTVTGLAAGVGAAATGIGLLGKQAASAYADFQQLEGGITTLYEDLDYDVFQNAAKAFQTAGLSQNEYMETAIGFAAALNSSLLKSEGNISRSADLTDQIIVDMADNVNKMGTSMEAVQNAYRGFSRGNFTMLDNLALGFAGTKEGMQQLLDKAVEYEKKQGRVAKFSIDSFADIAEAIHIVQDNMSISNATAEEAEKTISGSLNSMKAAWQNLLTGVANGDADVAGLTQKFAGSLKTVAKNLIPVVKTALSGLATLVTELAPELSAELPALIQDVLPSLITAAVTLATALGTALAENAPLIIGTLATAIGNNAPQLAAGAVQLVGALARGLLQALPSILTAGFQLVAALLGEIGKGFFELLGAGANLVHGLWQGISGAASWLWEQISGWLSGIWSGIKEFFGIASPSKEMAWAGEMLAEGLAGGIDASADDAVAAASRMNAGIRDAITGANTMMGASSAVEVRHTGSIRVEGVNSAGELVAVTDILYDQIVARLRQEVRYA